MCVYTAIDYTHLDIQRPRQGWKLFHPKQFEVKSSNLALLLLTLNMLKSFINLFVRTKNS